MACKVEQSTVAAIWPALLACRRFANRATTGPGALWLFESVDGWAVAAVDAAPTGADRPRVFARLDASSATPTAATHEFCMARFAAGEPPLRRCTAIDLHPRIETILRIYLPLVLGGWQARRNGEAFVAAHVAQTLDGRIACRNGHSQWISNEANLWHAHRLRALHDVVLVGGQTVHADDPQLNVRHVDGPDPARVILSGRASVLELAGDRQIFAAPGCTLICRSDALGGFIKDSAHEHIELCPLPIAGDDGLRVADVLAALAARGWHSVFVEGGSATLSSFLQHQAIDVLHVHVAPMILGSGVSSFTLPEVTHVRDGQHLQMDHFEVDDELMFECRPGEDRAKAVVE